MKTFTNVKSYLTQTHGQLRRQLTPIVWNLVLHQANRPIDNRVRSIIYGPHWSIDFSKGTAILTTATQNKVATRRHDT